MTESQDIRARVLGLLLDQRSADSDVDCEKAAEALGLSSLQQLAFLKAVNAEFGTNLTPEDLENARGRGGLMALLT